MSAFVFLNWGLCLTTSIFLITIFLRHRFLLIKPSIFIIVFFHLQIQWAATITSSHIETYLPNPWAFVLLVQGFPLVGLLGSSGLRQRTARKVWQRILEPSHSISPRIRGRAIVFLGISIMFFLAIYLYYVPIARTGLVTILTNPADSMLARENSLKLQSSSLVRYGYNFMTNVFAPLLAVLLVETIWRNVKQKNLPLIALSIIVLGGLLVAVSLSGARKPAAMIIFALLLAYFLRRGLPFNLLYVGLAILSVLALPLILSMLREGQTTINWSQLWLYSEAIFGRVFFVPMRTGLWRVHYAQTVEFVGVQGIPRLAALWGVPSINLSNVIYLTYSYAKTSSGLSNTGYVFAYYGYFGIISLPFSLLGLWLLDIAALWVYQRISDHLLLACVVSVSAASLAFNFAEYTSTLLTHGFGVLLVVVLILDRLSKKKVKFAIVQNTNLVSHIGESAT